MEKSAANALSSQIWSFPFLKIPRIYVWARSSRKDTPELFYLVLGILGAPWFLFVRFVFLGGALLKTQALMGVFVGRGAGLFIFWMEEFARTVRQRAYLSLQRPFQFLTNTFMFNAWAFRNSRPSSLELFCYIHISMITIGRLSWFFIYHDLLL